MDWEPGLREATYQALLREHYTHSNLKDEVFNAPLENRQDSATPFGDITVLGRGQLVSTVDGLKFIQDLYQNDCDDCHNFRLHCSQCNTQRLPATDHHVIALWTIKRIRHRNADTGHRYDLKYIIAPLNERVSFLTNKGDYNYNIPGHVFIVKTNPTPNQFIHRKGGVSSEYTPSPSWYFIKPNNAYTTDYNGYGQGVTYYNVKNGPRVEETTQKLQQHVLQENDEYKVENPRVKEVQLYKTLLNSLSLKTTSAYNPVIPSYAHSDIFDTDVGTVPVSTVSYSASQPQIDTTLTIHNLGNSGVTIPTKTLITSKSATLAPVYVTPSKAIHMEATTELKNIQGLQDQTRTTPHLQRPTPSLSSKPLSNAVTTTKSISNEQKRRQHSRPDPFPSSKPLTTTRSTHQVYQTPITTITYFTPANTETDEEILTSRPDSGVSSTKETLATKHLASDNDDYDIFGETTKSITNKPTKLFKDSQMQNSQLSKPEKDSGTTMSYRHSKFTQPTTLEQMETTTYQSTDKSNVDFPQSNKENATLRSTTITIINTDKFTEVSNQEHSTAAELATATETTSSITSSIPVITSPAFYSADTEITKYESSTVPNINYSKQFINSSNETARNPPTIPELKEESTSEQNAHFTVSSKFNTQRATATVEPGSTTRLKDTSTLMNSIKMKQRRPFELTTDATTSSMHNKHNEMKVNKLTSTKNNFDHDTILVDIFGEEENTDVIEKPVTVKVLQNMENEGEFLFGTESSDITTQPTKVIFDNFFEPSVASLTTQEMQTTNHLNTPTLDETTTSKSFKETFLTQKRNDEIPRTSLSYVTSISFHVNDTNNAETEMHMPLQTITYEPMVKAQISEMSTHDYQVYKAEIPETPTTYPTTKSKIINTKKEFDNLALTLVNHARSIDILHNRTKRTKYKRRRYRPTNKN